MIFVAVSFIALAALAFVLYKKNTAASLDLGRRETSAREAVERWYTLLEAIPDGVYIVDGDERITHINEEAERLLRGAGDFVGQSLNEIFDPLASDLLPEIRRARETRRAVARTAYFGAAAWWIELRIQPTDRETVVYLRDVTVRKGAEARLLESEGRLRLLMEQVPAVLWSVDRLGRFASLSGAGVASLQIEEKDLLGRPYSKFIGASDADTRLASVFEGTSLQFDSPHGERWLSHHVEPLRNAEGTVIGAVGVSLDISEIKDANERLEETAKRDALTGLWNRRGLEEHLRMTIGCNSSSRQDVAVLFIDLDRFKIINDTLGHHIGDEVLQLVAERLRASVSASDIVARQGGDEFIVVLKDITSLEDVRAVATRVQKCLTAPIIAANRQLYVTASVGAAIAPEHGSNPAELIKNADAAMYRAKADGRESVAVFETTMVTAAYDRLALEDDLRRAIGRGEMQLLFQPIVNVKSGRVAACEALLRWSHPTRGNLPPSLFIQIAEESGAIIDITRWVLAQACNFSAATRRRRSDFRVTVNLSPRDLREPGVVRMIAQQLQNSNLDPDGLELEVTESALVDDAAVEALHGLRALGVRIAVDDFGIAYNSLLYVKRLPITSLKIDRAFIQHVDTDDRDQAIVRAIVALASGLGLHVIAEGIETEEQFAFIAALGCGEAQGYRFGRAVTGQAIDAMLSGSSNVLPFSRIGAA